MMPKTLHTMARAYQDICAGEDPWTALGNFKNAWYDYARDHRAALEAVCKGRFDPLRKGFHTIFLVFGRCACRVPSDHFTHSLSAGWRMFGVGMKL